MAVTGGFPDFGFLDMALGAACGAHVVGGCGDSGDGSGVDPVGVVDIEGRGADILFEVFRKGEDAGVLVDLGIEHVNVEVVFLESLVFAIEGDFTHGACFVGGENDEGLIHFFAA